MARQPEVIRARVSGTRTVRTYVYMYRTAKLLLEEAGREEEGQFFRLMGSIVFAAFAVEAFLNHVGEKKVADWLTKERKMTQQQRLTTILSEVGLEESGLPLADVRTAFRFRDGMAHGKTAVLNLVGHERDVDTSKPFGIPIETDWELQCTIQRTVPVVKACWNLIEQIHKASGFNGRPFSGLGGGSYTLTNIRESHFSPSAATRPRRG